MLFKRLRRSRLPQPALDKALRFRFRIFWRLARPPHRMQVSVLRCLGCFVELPAGLLHLCKIAR